MNRYQQHQDKLNKTTLYLQKKFPEAKFFSRHVGKFYSPRVFHSLRKVNSIVELKRWLISVKDKFRISINKKGMPDQYVIFPILINGKRIPVHVEIETKSGSAKLSPEQRDWKKKYEMMSVKFITSRDEKEVEKELNEYINWINS